MSRSFRHNPWISMTCAGYRRGEKRDKIIWHQQHRSRTKQILRTIHSYDDSLDITTFPHKHDVNIWNWLKDGKQKVSMETCRHMHWTKDGYLKK